MLSVSLPCFVFVWLDFTFQVNSLMRYKPIWLWDRKFNLLSLSVTKCRVTGWKLQLNFSIFLHLLPEQFFLTVDSHTEPFYKSDIGRHILRCWWNTSNRGESKMNSALDQIENELRFEAFLKSLNYPEAKFIWTFDSSMTVCWWFLCDMTNSTRTDTKWSWDHFVCCCFQSESFWSSVLNSWSYSVTHRSYHDAHQQANI